MRLLKRLVDILLWLSVIVLLLSAIAPRVVSALDGRFGIRVRMALSSLTAPVLIPVVELIVIALPVLLVALIVRGRLSGITTVAKLLIITYAISLGIPSATPPRISASDEPSTDEYIRAATLIGERLAVLPPVCTDLGERAVLAAVAYARDTLELTDAAPPSVKRTLLPPVLTSIGVIAYYAFPTAEVVVNTAAPGFMQTLATAHETMHFLGIGREDEANLFALAALFESGDEALEFSAYLNAFVYVGARLCTQDRDTYARIYALLPEKVTELLSQRQDFLSSRSHSASSISSTLNDLAVTLRDPRGSDSYSATAPLIVHYLLGNSFSSFEIE